MGIFLHGYQIAVIYSFTTPTSEQTIHFGLSCTIILLFLKITEGFMDICFCYPVNQNILSIALKNIFTILFFGIKCYINQAMNNIFTYPSANAFII